MHPDNLAGQSLQLTCCPASIRNVCKVQLAASGQGLVELHAQVVKSLNSCADRWGKSRCNESRILLMAECVLSTGDVARHFGLLARAWFNPKWQLWCSVEHVGPVPAVLAPPFVVRLVGEPTRICPAKQGLAVRTGDDFAELVARSSLGGRFSFFELRYQTRLTCFRCVSMAWMSWTSRRSRGEGQGTNHCQTCGPSPRR